MSAVNGSPQGKGILPVRVRYMLMTLAVIALVTGMWAGLLRLGWGFPSPGPTLPGAHGALMVGGFLGTLIGLERAVALRQRWAYVAPLLSGLGGIALLLALGLPWPLWAAGPFLLTLGSIALVAVYIAVLRVQFTLFTATMALGAIIWACGNILWMVWLPIYQTTLWWAGFLALTILGERLELTRMLPRKAASQPLFLLAAAIYVAGIVLSVPLHDLGSRVMGAGMLCLALWLARYDIARRTVLRRGVTRFIAASLLAGYVWLLFAGVIAMLYGGVAAGPSYDALLHSIFLGFVFSMIFAHAPVILPAVTGLALPFRSAFYAHVLLLQVSLVLRIGSDLAGWADGRQWGGLLNVVALLLFMGNTALAVVIGKRMAARTTGTTGTQSPHTQAAS
ncbi:MAG: hypothetical protein ABI670_23290 [Chloroflexota bacterium]